MTRANWDALWRSRVLRRILVALLIAPAAVGAQGMYSAQDTTIHLLDIPSGSGPFRCQEVARVPDSVTKLGFRQWEFRIGGPLAIDLPIQPRTITAGFDSTGRPVFLTDMVVLPPVRTGHLFVRFTPGKPAWGHLSDISYDSASVARMRGMIARGNADRLGDAMPPVRTRDVITDEAQRARMLMSWLWNHRCGIHSGARN